MAFTTTVPCPDCNTSIAIETTQLLSGVGFSCPNPLCSVSISLDQADAGRVAQTVEEFDRIKKESVEMANQANQQP